MAHVPAEFQRPLNFWYSVAIMTFDLISPIHWSDKMACMIRGGVSKARVKGGVSKIRGPEGEVLIDLWLISHNLD